MSTFFGGLTLGAAMTAMAGEIGKPVSWMPKNSEQRLWLRSQMAYMNALLYVPTAKGWAARSADPLNEVLAANGFDTRLQAWSNSDTFGLATVNDFNISWLAEGEIYDEKRKETVLVRGHPAFRLKNKEAGVSFLKATGYEEPIIRVITQSGDQAFFVKMSVRPGVFSAIEAVEAIRQRRPTALTFTRFAGVQLPMVLLNLEAKLEWLKAFTASDGALEYYIGEALQQVKFGMNQHGARIMEATAIRVQTRHTSEYYLFDSPFLMWIERPRVSVPLSVFYITEEHWADPGDLSKL